ncbi:MAG: SDR family oxidoreductase [Deltaproteobacteria bacterium]|nr:SDR family oxidoreductase [Deltaproteobacteria bacterium]
MAEYGINVNGIAPGYVKMQLTEGLLADRERCESVLSKIPMRRFADAQDVAPLVLYLASPLATYMTGQTIFIEGEMHID